VTHPLDPLEHSIEVDHDRAGTDSKNLNTPLSHPRVSGAIGVPSFGRCVISTVDLNDEAGLVAIEVRHAGAERMLASELQSIEPSGAESLPENSFGRGLVLTEGSGFLDGAL